MAKLDPLTTITSGFNSTAQLNSNFTKIEEAFDNTLSRDGSAPNFMDAVLDMNSNRIINLLDPVDNQDAVTKSFLEANISGDVDIAAAAASAAAALVSETNAATSATEAAAVENSQISYTFDADTTMNDPGLGDFKYNNASVASVTAIAFDATMAQTGNPDVSDYIVTWDDSTNTITGHVTLIKRGNAEVFAIFTVSAVTDNTGWLQVTVSHVSSSGTFSATDTVDIQFARAGDTGGSFIASDITGQSSGTVALTDNFVYEDGAGGLETDTIQGIVDLSGLDAADITGQTPGTVALTDSFVYENGAGGLETDSIQGIVDLSGAGQFTQEFVSSQQVPPDDSLLTVAHGLGSGVKLVTCELVCTTAELSWAIGDVVAISSSNGTPTSSVADTSIVHNDTNIFLAQRGDRLRIVHKNISTTSFITTASWKIVFRAYK